MEAGLKDEKFAANFLGVKQSTIQKMRHFGHGPKFIRLGRTIRYSLEDLQKYVDQRRVDPAV